MRMPNIIRYVFSLLGITLMSWQWVATNYTGTKVNWFFTTKHTFEQHPKWYAFFTHHFTEDAIFVVIIYYLLSKMYGNLKFLVPWVVYYAYRIFEYWTFAFSLDRYMILTLLIILSNGLYAKYVPYKRNG